MGFRLLGLLLLVVAALSPARASADQKDPRLSGLFDRLKVTESELEARALEADIWRIWGESDDPGAAAMLRRGEAAMQEGDYPGALAVLDALIARQPTFAEAWNKRATLYFLMGDFDSSVADI